MAFKNLPREEPGVRLLQRSLERGRLAHGYLFTGDQLEDLEGVARSLAKTLNCQRPVKSGNAATDCCDECAVCRKIDEANHADIHWVRPESKTRVITMQQMQDLMQEIHLKPNEAEYKVCVVVAADRLNDKSANAFLKTLEEPPAKSILILLTTEPQRMLETILSRCLRLNFGAGGRRTWGAAQMEWLAAFSEMAGAEQKSLLGRYRLMDVLLRRLTELREAIQKTLEARSPMEKYPDAEKEWVEKWEEELAASVEAEYRRQRSEFLLALEWWLRDVWLRTIRGGPPVDGHAPVRGVADELLNFPQMTATERVAQRISNRDALENLSILEQLQRWLGTNVQEALAIEVGLLKLRL
jgi:DNA polymerase-3 subunit delta'